jgi:serine/threonine protein kinase
VASPAQRAVAGVTLVERLSVGLYGELHRAHDGRRDLRALIVDPRLAAEPGFSAALLDGSAARLASLHHRAVVGTVSVSRDGGDLVVVTEPVLGGAALSDLLAEARGQGGKLSGPIAAAVARAVVDALATAHGMGIVHGAVHPRSVMIDSDGAVRLGDFAVGRALATAAAGGAGGSLLRGLAGYVAPELALGDPPGPAADVYAVGAMVFTMLSGETPPGSLHLSPAMERLVQRALDTDLTRRFGNAIELQENLTEAVDDDRWEAAPAVELERWVGDSRVASAADLDEATEDLLASLADAVAEAPTRQPPDLAGLGEPTGETVLGTGETERAPSASGELDGVLADLDESTDVPHTVVDPTRAGERDPVSALIALDPHAAPTRVSEPEVTIAPTRRGSSGRDADRTDSTPLPPPAPDAPGTITRGGEAVAGTGRKRIVERAALDAIDELDGEEPARPARRARPAVAEPDLGPPPSVGRSSATWLWLVLIAGAVAVLVWVVTRSGTTYDQRKHAHDQAVADQQQRAAAKTAELAAELPDPGGIQVTSTPDGAAVWLMLGRTPFDSMGLPSGMVHELRVELDGYTTRDVDVGGRDWTHDGKAHVAHVSVGLQLGDGKRLPAIPAKPDPALSDGLVEGRGVLHVESTPPGAAVWLLVGVTGSMDLEGIEAGRDYELRVDKDGYLPGHVHISAEEWRNGGDPKLPLSAAPKQAVMERAVTLTPAPHHRGRAGH